MTTTRRLLHAVLAAALLAALPAQAAVSGVMTYSGFLKSAAGAPVTTSTNITFRLYTTSSGGTAIWTDTVAVTPGADGWFSAPLGILNPLLPAIMAQDLYLSLQVGTDAEFAQRARVTPSGSALAVDWSGVQGKPSCATGQYLTLDSATGNLLCATPAGGTGGFTPPTCTTGQVLKWSGTAWACAADDTGGTGGVTSVAVTAPVTNGGTSAAPNIGMTVAGSSSDGYLTALDWNAFNSKAPTASPVFTGTVSAGTVSATTFVGSLSGNASTATSATTAGSATTATTATTALSADAVAANAITPSDLNTGTAPGTGQVPSKGAGDSFTWVSPLAAPPAACAGGQVLSWNGSAFGCVADANTTYTAGAGLNLTGTQFTPVFTASGGNNGVATTVARGDHGHDFGAVGVKVVDFASMVNVSGAVTSQFLVASLTVPAGTNNTVVLTAHLNGEKFAVSAFSRYIVSIFKGAACTGAVVGLTWHRPPSLAASASQDTFMSFSIPVTGVDSPVTGAQAYSLCVSKVDTTAADLNIGPRSFIATWSR